MSTEHLFQQQAIEKLKELAEKARNCMFVTKINDKPPFNARPMSLQEVCSEGNLWFISSKESNKNFEIEDDNSVLLYFMNNSNMEFLSVYGKAFIYDDRSTIEEKWSNFANAWFEEGKEDPNVSIIRVQPSDTYYWDTKAGKFVSMLTFVAAAVTGNKTDNSDGVEGELKI